MQHERDAGRGEIGVLSPGTWAANSADISPKTSEKLTPAFSKHVAIHQHPRSTAAAALPLPAVLLETARAVELFQLGANAVLQTAKKRGGLFLERVRVDHGNIAG